MIPFDSHLAALAVALALVALPAAAAQTLSPAEEAAAARVSGDEISGHLRFLSDDLLEGRAPGERGDALAVKYLAAQLEAAGLQPGLPGEGGKPASWFQEAPLVKLTAAVPPTVEVRGPKGTLQLSTRGGKEMDLIVAPGAEVERVKLDQAEVVFVGYGITAPESAGTTTAAPTCAGRWWSSSTSTRPSPGRASGSGTVAGTTSTRTPPGTAPRPRSSSTPRPRPATRGRC